MVSNFCAWLLYLFISVNQHGSELVDQLQEQENVLQQCVRLLESAETTRAALVYLLKAALQDQVRFLFLKKNIFIFFSQPCIYIAKFCNFSSLRILNFSGIKAGACLHSVASKNKHLYLLLKSDFS